MEKIKEVLSNIWDNDLIKAMLTFIVVMLFAVPVLMGLIYYIKLWLTYFGIDN